MLLAKTDHNIKICHRKILNCPLDYLHYLCRNPVRWVWSVKSHSLQSFAVDPD